MAIISLISVNLVINLNLVVSKVKMMMIIAVNSSLKICFKINYRNLKFKVKIKAKT